MAYQRPWCSYQDQLEILKSRGMVVTDEDAALSYLERVGYYRLSAYWYPFRIFKIDQDKDSGQLVSIRQDDFVANTQFVDAVDLYLFDKKLRLLVLDALERIEVAIRVDIAYLLGERDVFAYQNLAEFHPTFANRESSAGKTQFDKWQERYAGLLVRSKEDFVKHYRIKHGPDLPIWVAVEVWDFGAISQLFSMMKAPDQEKIAKKYCVDDFKVFASWLRSLNYLRNLAAHHSRLWNRNVIDQPSLPQRGIIPWCNEFIGKADLIAKPFLLLAIVRHMVSVICPNTGWHVRLREHIDQFPAIHSDRKVTAEDIGLTENWRDWWG